MCAYILTHIPHESYILIKHCLRSANILRVLPHVHAHAAELKARKRTGHSAPTFLSYVCFNAKRVRALHARAGRNSVTQPTGSLF